MNLTNIKPAELAGSTPDDRPLPDNMDLYAMPSRPRSSREQIRRMPTLAERVERDLQLNGLSTASTNPADKPVLAKRYRPGIVQVRNRGVAKHRSLPTRLPTLPSHPSLITELSQWVLPEAPRNSFDSYETESYDTPSTSVASSPAVLTSTISCPERLQSIPPTTACAPNTSDTDAGGVQPETMQSLTTNDAAGQNLVNPNTDNHNVNNQNVGNHKVDIQNVDDQNVHDQNVHNDNVDKKNIDVDNNGDQTIDHENVSSQKVDDQKATEVTSKASEKSTVGEEERIPQVINGEHPKEIKEVNEDVETKAPQNHSTRAEGQYRELTAKQDEPESKTSTPPINPETERIQASEATPPSNSTLLLTSQAKRRRAHARRMQSAYGS